MDDGGIEGDGSARDRRGDAASISHAAAEGGGRTVAPGSTLPCEDDLCAPGPHVWKGIVGRTALTVSALLLETASIAGGGEIGDRLAPGLLPRSTPDGLWGAAIAISVSIWTIRRRSQLVGVADRLLLLALLLGVLAASRAGLDELGAIAVWFLLSSVSIVLVRGAARLMSVRLPASRLPRTVAFIGNSDAAARMVRQLDRAAEPVDLVGYFDDRLTRPGPLTDVLPCLGTVDDLVLYIHGREITDIYMALPWSAGPRISELVDRLRFLPLTVRLLPDHVPPALPGRGDGQVQGVVMPTLMTPPFSKAGATWKRACDLGLGGLLLLPLLPLFVGVAVCIWLDSSGPIFFRQVRSGQYGRPFRIFKFRTLHVAQADAGAETLVTGGDRRVTRVGRVLRKYSIDELPQVMNVLLGHMSLVGPRPHAPKAKADGRIYAEVVPEYMLRYRVKPGMTGWAQVNGWRGNTDNEEQLRKRVEFDFQYIGDWSAFRDLKIILRTIPAMMMPPPQNV